MATFLMEAGRESLGWVEGSNLERAWDVDWVEVDWEVGGLWSEGAEASVGLEDWSGS